MGYMTHPYAPLDERIPRICDTSTEFFCVKNFIRHIIGHISTILVGFSWIGVLKYYFKSNYEEIQ